MQEYVNGVISNDVFLIGIITALISSGILNAFISHFLYKYKLRRDVMSKGSEQMVNVVGSSLRAFRDFETKFSTWEIVDMNSFTNGEINLFSGATLKAPAVMYNSENIVEMINTINEFRGEYEKNLPRSIALELVYMSNYLMNLAAYCKSISNSHDEVYPYIGFILGDDIWKWQKRVDKKAIKYINKNWNKLQPHSGIKWKLYRMIVVELQWNESILCNAINEKWENRKLKKKAGLLQNLKETA